MQMTCNKLPRIFGSRILFFFSIPLFLICVSCERGVTKTDEEPVLWPEITRFDDIAFRADGYVRVKDYSAVRELYGDLLEAGKAVKMATVPSQIANSQEVEVLLGDLTNMIDGLEADGLDDATLGNLVLGLHPVIAKLIEAAGIPHVHENEGPNSGFLFPLFDSEGKQSGTVEIKLHDDAGDVEVWLKRGGYDGEAWRLPLDSTLTLDFPSEGKKVTLAVRDGERNEDESGESTIFDGKTDYFVFPADTGVDASWLMGSEFAAKAELSFGAETTGSFVLRPHVHREKGK
jgi:hypothetical protein